MKKRTLFTVFFLSLVTCLPAEVLVVDHLALYAKAPQNKMRSPELKKIAPIDKLDARARHLIEEGDKLVNVILKTSVHVEKSERDELKRVGFSYHTIVGDIVTGRIMASNIMDLAALSFVVHIEAAVPLSGK